MVRLIFLQNEVIDSFQGSGKARRCNPDPLPKNSPGICALEESERTIYDLYCAGMEQKEIAEKLNMSIYNVCRKLQGIWSKLKYALRLRELLLSDGRHMRAFFRNAKYQRFKVAFFSRKG